MASLKIKKTIVLAALLWLNITEAVQVAWPTYETKPKRPIRKITASISPNDSIEKFESLRIGEITVLS